MEIGVVFQSIFMITLLILIGAIVARYYVFNKDTQKLFITIITNVAVPSIILSSIFQVGFTGKILKTMGIIFVLSIMINLLGLLLGYIGRGVLRSPFVWIHALGGLSNARDFYQKEGSLRFRRASFLRFL